VPHPTRVLHLSRRVAAIALTIGLSLGNFVVCAGWQATPEERMACCMHRTSCPMHNSASSGSKRAMTQEQADNCCAAGSTRTATSVTNSTVIGLVATSLTAATPPPVLIDTPALQLWRVGVSRPASHVPRHLLLSVLLV
jgi:hypothetical protein